MQVYAYKIVLLVTTSGHWSVEATAFWIGSFFSSHNNNFGPFLSLISHFLSTEVHVEFLSYFIGFFTVPLISVTCSSCRWSF
jgi:hypothetical protein